MFNFLSRFWTCPNLDISDSQDTNKRFYCLGCLIQDISFPKRSGWWCFCELEAKSVFPRFLQFMSSCVKKMTNAPLAYFQRVWNWSLPSWTWTHNLIIGWTFEDHIHSWIGWQFSLSFVYDRRYKVPLWLHKTPFWSLKILSFFIQFYLIDSLNFSLFH